METVRGNTAIDKSSNLPIQTRAGRTKVKEKREILIENKRGKNGKGISENQTNTTLFWRSSANTLLETLPGPKVEDSFVYLLFCENGLGRYS